MSGTLRGWWRAQKLRSNYGEFMQAVLRAVIGLLLVFGYVPLVDWGPHTWAIDVYLGFLAYALVIFVWVLRTKTSPGWLRYLTLTVDSAIATSILGLTGERSAILLFVFTWMALGHGFRYGLKELYVAWAAGLVSSVLVYALSAAVDGFWYRYPLVWLGAFVWVVAPTFYIARLLQQVAARMREEARVQLERAEAERARAEAVAASEAKSEFLATMSHEMRTPLNGVVGAAELLATKDLPKSDRQLVDWLLTSSRQLRSLIDNLLDLRKIEAGKMVIELAPFDLHALMNRLAALFEPEAKRRQLRFTKSVSADAPYLLLGDAMRIQQVLINLTANALKFTERGFVRASVRALERSDGKVELRFEVRDTGIGIAPEHAASIFDRFTQANPGIHRQYGGSGLGTTICKHLVELMGGAIGFEARPESGTTFWFTVALARAAEDAHADDGASVSETRLFLLSGRRKGNEWLARAAEAERLGCASFAALGDALAAAREEAGRAPCVLFVDGEDPILAWHGVPEAIRGEGLVLPCVLVHPAADEVEAFDGGYASVLRARESSLLARALRSVLVGSVSLQPREDSPGRDARTREGLHILVAEDNQISQQIIALMLRAGGHHVTVVGDGEGVLENRRNVSFDVVILDMHMPGQTGLEVAREIRMAEMIEGKRRMPIIMLTAAASTDLREESIGAGVDLFLSKPVDPRALLRGVDQVLSGAVHAVSTAPSPGTEEYVDRALLREMAELAADSGLIRNLSAKFARDAAQLVDEMKDAVTRGNGRELRELAHALKSASMMAGALRLQESAARVETLAASGFDEVSADMIEDLRGTLEATKHAYSSLIG